MSSSGQRDEWLEAIDTAYAQRRISKRKWIGLRVLYLFSGGQPRPKKRTR